MHLPRSSSRRWITGAGSVGLVLAGFAPLWAPLWAPLQAQQPASGPQFVSGSGAMTVTAPESLRARPTKTVSLQLHDVTLQAALEAIRAQSGIKLLYGDRVVPIDRRVSLSVDRVSVLDALHTVLRGTGVRVKVARDGSMTLIKPDSATSSAADSTFGVVAGIVRDAARGAPLAHAQITLENGRPVAATGPVGLYTIRVAAGRHTVTARALGYGAQSREVTVTANDTIAADFSLTSLPAQLREVVTTGSGARERYQIGNSVGSVNADSVVATSAIANFSDLLTNRVRGVEVTSSSGQVGAASRIRIRGISSVVGSNDPILIIDGVRVSNAYPQCRLPGAINNDPVCATTPSRIDDIDPSIIESVDVLRGPSASNLYGSDAANGVIVIKTKRGHVGPPRFHAMAERGLSYYDKNFPTLTKAVGSSLAGGSPVNCNLLLQNGLCPHLDSVLTSNILNNPQLTPLAHGQTSTIEADVSGGVTGMQYFFQGRYRDELGAIRMPTLTAHIISVGQGLSSLPNEMVRPNAQTNADFGGRMTGQLGEAVDFSVGALLERRYQRSGIDGLQDVFNFRAPGDTLSLSPAWNKFYYKYPETTTHTTDNANVTWHPSTWFNAHATYGLDFSLRSDKTLAQQGACSPFCSSASNGDSVGFLTGGRMTTYLNSVDLGATITERSWRALAFRTSLGAQYTRTTTNDFGGSIRGLAAGQTDFQNSYFDGSSNTTSGTLFETGDDQATFGTYIDQSISLNDRLFVNAGIRRDVASQLGDGVRPTYPKVNASWVVSQEPFFPWKGWMTLRLRAAYGHAGVQPPSSSKLLSYEVIPSFATPTGNVGGAIDISNLGNPLIRPERSVEQEQGFDLSLWQDRVTVEVTHFHKYTRDALVPRPLPLSFGAGTPFQARTIDQNIGDVRNLGNEETVTFRVLEGPRVSYSADVGFSSRHNVLVNLGQGVTPFDLASGGTTYSRVVQGYPLFGRWARPVLGYYDRNGDGILQSSEVVIGDSAVYLGASEPKYDLSTHQTLGLLHDRLQIRADFQYTNGLVQVNQFLSNNVLSLACSQVKSACSLEQQAYAFAATPNQVTSGTNGPVGGPTLYGYIERTNVLRFNNLSFQFMMPARVAAAMHARNASLLVLGSNLGIWTNYQGKDPNNNSTGAAGNQLVDSGTLPQPKTWAVRLNFNF